MKKNLPEADFRFDGLIRLQSEAVKWELIKTSIRLKVYDSLQKPKTAEKIASELSLHRENTEYMLKALVAIGMLELHDGCYINSDFSEKFFVSGSEQDIGRSILYIEAWNKPIFNGGLEDMVKKGSSVSDLSDEAVWEDFARNTVNLIRCGKAQAFTEHIVSLPEFSSFEKMLDMGAGPGVLGISVAGAHPSAECVLMDRASVCVVADEVIKEYGMESRVKTMAGDYTSDPLGEDYDLIIASHTLNFYSGSFDKLMAKVLAALKPGGVFIVFGDGLNREKTAPETSVISWLSASLMHTDLSFGVGVIDDAMLKAGFVSTQSFVESRMTGHGPTVVTVGRKKKG